MRKEEFNFKIFPLGNGGAYSFDHTPQIIVTFFIETDGNIIQEFKYFQFPRLSLKYSLPRGSFHVLGYWKAKETSNTFNFQEYLQNMALRVVILRIFGLR